MRSIICVSAVLDYLFSTQRGHNNSKENIASFEMLFKETGREIWKTAALKQSLGAKLKEQVRDKWVELRQTALALHSIRDYEQSLEMKHAMILEPTKG